MLHRAGLVLSLGLLASWSLADLRPRHDFVLTDTEAIGAMPPEVVCQGEVKTAMWSSDGRYLLVLRLKDFQTPETWVQTVTGAAHPPEREQQLILWNGKTHQATPVITLKESSGNILYIDWLPGSDTALIHKSTIARQPDGTATEGQEVVLLAATSGRTRMIARASQTESMAVFTSPSKPVALIGIEELPQAQGDKPAAAYQIYGQEGPTSAVLRVPARMRGITWGADGLTPFIWQRVKSEDAKGFRTMLQAMNFSLGTVTEVNSPPLYRDKFQTDGPVRPADTTSKLTLSQVTASIHSLWLSSDAKTEFPSCLLCADASGAIMSPAADAVFYLSDGIGYVRPLVHLPKDLFLKELAAADKQQAMQDAKMCGTALALYCSDCDDKMPMKEADMFSLLYPYCKNGDMLKNFVYTFEGGDINNVQSPSTTEVGYIAGPGGRAVVYLDTHVKWKSNNP